MNEAPITADKLSALTELLTHLADRDFTIRDGAALRKIPHYAPYDQEGVRAGVVGANIHYVVTNRREVVAYCADTESPGEFIKYSAVVGVRLSDGTILNRETVAGWSAVIAGICTNQVHERNCEAQNRVYERDSKDYFTVLDVENAKVFSSLVGADLRLKVVADPLHAGKHPFHDSRYIMTEGAEIVVYEGTVSDGRLRDAEEREPVWFVRNGSLICTMRDVDPKLTQALAAAPQMQTALLALLCEREAIAQQLAERTGITQTYHQGREQAWVALEQSGIPRKEIAALTALRDPVTDLHEAARMGRLAEVADRLNEQSIALQNEDGQTVAHVAVLYGHFDQLPAGLQTAATLQLKNADGRTVLDEGGLSGRVTQFPAELLEQLPAADRPMTHAEIVEYATSRGVIGARLEHENLGWHLVGSGTGTGIDGCQLVSAVCEELGMLFGGGGTVRGLDGNYVDWHQCSPHTARPPGSRKDRRDYLPETLSLLDHLNKAGFELVDADNGEERHRITSPEMAAAVLTVTDESQLYVKAPDGKRLGLFLVYGNNPGELVADHHVHPLLEATVSACADEWEGREQPMTDRATAEAFTQHHYPKMPAAQQAKRR